MKAKQISLKRTLAGLLTGAVNGLFGGGGGMVAVPLLKNMLGYDEKNAHATAILIIAPVCAVSAVTYIVNGYFSADVVFGYFSNKDGLRHRWDLCEHCYDALTRDFRIPVEESEESELV